MSQIATPQGGGSVNGGNGDVASQTVHFTTLTPMSKHKVSNLIHIMIYSPQHL